MESELERMLVGGWVQRDRARLLKRIEALERDLSLVSSRRQQERHIFATQKTILMRRMVATEEKCQSVLKEVSLRANGEEKLRRICQGRLQEFETETILLRRQLDATRAKFCETQKALRRHCKQRANEDSDRRSPCCAAPSTEKNESAVEPAEKEYTRRKDAEQHSEETKATSVNAKVGCYHRDAYTLRCALSGLEGSNGEIDLPNEDVEEVKELRIVERLVAGLLQDNLRLETTVKQLQNCCGHTSRRGGPGGRDVRLPRAIINNRASRCELQEEFVEGSWQAEPELPQSPSDTIPPNNSKTMSMEESTPQEKKESSEPVAKNCGNWRRKDGLRSPGDGVEDNGGAITDTKMAGRDCILGCTVLSKTEALKGMVQAQEKIERLLCQELNELKKRARDCDRLWQLVFRWKAILEAKGYPSENDVRAVGLSDQLCQRYNAAVRTAQDFPTIPRSSRTPALVKLLAAPRTPEAAGLSLYFVW